MIRRRRHAEPEALRQQRVWRVAAWVLYQLGELAEPPGVDEGYNLEEVREALLTAQHFSCGYCGFPIDKTGTTLEHFRPRGLYPWLSWTWENIWLSCPTCATKGAGFPLFDETRRLTSSTMFSLEQEAPCWLDPGVDDPREHLIYYIGTRGYQEGWLGRTPRGLATASDFKLNRERREGLMGLYRYHQTHLDRYCKQIEQLIEEAKIEALIPD